MPSRALQSQSTEQQLALAGRASSWLTMALAIWHPRDASRDVVEEPGLVRVNPRDHYGYLATVHMLVLAFHHAHKCLRLVSPRWPDSFPSTEAGRFISAWAPLRDLRNVLEHEEDYIAGQGHNPELVGPAGGWTLGRDNVRIPGHSSAHHLDAGGRPVALTVMGVTYDLTPVIDAARALRTPLDAYLQPPAREPTPSRKLVGWGYIYNETDEPLTLPSGDVVPPGALYSEGTVVADPLPDGMALLERTERWDQTAEEWDANQRAFVAKRGASDAERTGR